MSIASDSLDAIFNVDETVEVRAGTTVGRGYLDEPTSIIAGDQVLYVDYVVHVKDSDFGTLQPGDSLTIADSNGDDIAYTVRNNETDLDGLTRQISVQKT
jgi:hypothetical protein